MTQRRLRQPIDPHHESGSSFVELGLVVTFLLLLLFGIVQFGLALHVHQGLQAAAREGARIAALPQSTVSEIESRVEQTLTGADVLNFACPATEVGDYCTTVTPPVTQPCNLRRGDPVTVEVRQVSRIDIPLWRSSEFIMTGRGVFRCEG